MTAYRFVTLTCDECGEISDGGTDRSVKEARSTARAEGWAYQHRRDICPSHRGYQRTEFGWVRMSQPDSPKVLETNNGITSVTRGVASSNPRFANFEGLINGR